MMTIERLEEKLRQAMLDSDVPILDELIADDLIFTMHTGLVVDKQYDLDAHRSGMHKFTKVEIDDQQILNYGNFAVVAVKTYLAGMVILLWSQLKHIWREFTISKLFQLLIALLASGQSIKIDGK